MSRMFVTSPHLHMTQEPEVILHQPDGPQPPLASVDLGEFTVYLEDAADARKLIAAFAKAAGLLEQASRPAAEVKAWGGVL